MSLIEKLRALITLGQGMVGGLPELTAADDPIILFKGWYASAKQAGLFLPEAMTLATCTKDGAPSARMMLLKGVDSEGFVFYTNYESRKATELIDSKQAALVFHWPTLQRQVRVEGAVAKVSQRESEAYFRSRPRGSRIGAWASKQSSVLGSRMELEQSFQEYERRFEEGDIPLPDFWGGFRLRPQRIEFWQGRIDRLHDRVCYQRVDGGWQVVRLYP
jgi:pyridoxamine 5'-phosphate oxidase